MNIDNLNEAIEEAERFFKRAQVLRKIVRDTLGDCAEIYGFPVEQGMVKRASMDLTRALSKLRNR